MKSETCPTWKIICIILIRLFWQVFKKNFKPTIFSSRVKFSVNRIRRMFQQYTISLDKFWKHNTSKYPLLSSPLLQNTYKSSDQSTNDNVIVWNKDCSLTREMAKRQAVSVGYEIFAVKFHFHCAWTVNFFHLIEKKTALEKEHRVWLKSSCTTFR